MLNNAYLQKLVENFAASKVGKTKIKKVYGIEYNSKKDDGKIARKYAHEMKAILLRHINEVIPSIDKENIEVNEPIFKKDGSVIISLSFREGALFRPSLQPDFEWKKGKNVGEQDGKFGIMNIALHFNYGWNASGSVVGSWRGKNDVWSRKSYDGTPFLSDAVAEFNTKTKGVAVAELQGEYAEQ